MWPDDSLWREPPFHRRDTSPLSFTGSCTDLVESVFRIEPFTIPRKNSIPLALENHPSGLAFDASASGRKHPTR